MYRRRFLTGSIGFALAAALPRAGRAAQSATAEAALPELSFTLTEDGFEIPEPLIAGRYEFTLVNGSESLESHTAIGKIPDRITDAHYAEWLESLQQSNGEDGETENMTWDDIEFIGIPDWPKPGGEATGVINLRQGRYFLFDPWGVRGYQQLTVGGEFAPGAEPESDLTVTMTEMAFDLPDAAFTTEPKRWKIVNAGAMTHEVAVVPVSADFTEEYLHALFAMPEDATPPPGTPELVYQPVAAIGLLGKQQTSWLDVQIAPGRYLAACMAPFGTGYPHAMDGMYHFFDVT